MERVQRVGSQIKRAEIDAVKIASLNGSRHNSSINGKTIEQAYQAVKPATNSWGSILGRLEDLRARKGRDPRAVIYMARTRRAIVVRASRDQTNQLRDAWGRDVLATGQLTRNSSGQPIRLELTQLEIVEPSPNVSAWSLLGVAPMG